MTISLDNSDVRLTSCVQHLYKICYVSSFKVLLLLTTVKFGMKCVLVTSICNCIYYTHGLFLVEVLLFNPFKNITLSKTSSFLWPQQLNTNRFREEELNTTGKHNYIWLCLKYTFLCWLKLLCKWWQIYVFVDKEIRRLFWFPLPIRLYNEDIIDMLLKSNFNTRHLTLPFSRKFPRTWLLCIMKSNFLWVYHD